MEQDLIYGKYHKVKENYQETYYFQNPKDAALKDFEFEKKFIETEVCLPLESDGSATLLHKMPDMEVKKNHDGHSKQDSSSISMQWRANVGVTGGKYYYEIKIIEKPSIVMLGWSSAKTRIFQDTVFSFGTDPNAYMLDCSAGVLWHDGCTQSRVCSAAEIDDIYGSVLDYDEKCITFYHIRRGKKRVLETARFDVESFPALKSVNGPLFPSVALYCGKVGFYPKSIGDLDSTSVTPPISQGFEDKIKISLVHSTNVPKAPSLAYYVVTLEWMQKIYVKFFDGTAIPYGADAFKHMTLPFFSIFQPQLFQDEDGNSGAPDPEMFNAQPEELWSLFFRAFLFAALFEGFDAYIKERDAIYQKQYFEQNPTTETRNINLIRPRSTLEIRYESAMKCGLLLVQSLDFDDVKENGLYVQNSKELVGLLRKCDIRLDNMDSDTTAVEKTLLILWEKVLNLYSQNKNEPFPTEENLEMKLQHALNVITDAQAELQTRVKGVWEAYILFNLPNLEFPQTQRPLKDHVRLAKTSLVYYLDPAPLPLDLSGDKATTLESTTTIKENLTEKVSHDDTPSILRDDSDNTVILGVVIAGAAVLIGGFYYFMKKND
jgi:hypothetical protein